MLNSLFDKLCGACRELGVEFKPVDPDGNWYRTNIENDSSGKSDASIKVFQDGKCGIVKNWKTGEQRLVFHDNGENIRPVTKVKQSDNERYCASAKKANEIWNLSEPAPVDHPYLVRKNIKPCGIRQYKGSLVVPVFIGNEITSLQFVSPEGEKRFLKDGRVAGGFFIIRDNKMSEAICIAEGFATSASIHEATGCAVSVAFNAGNLLPTAKALRDKFPDLMLIMCADDDYRTDGNPGLAQATAAAQVVNGLLAVPDFGSNRPVKASDFNDMAELRGNEAVKKCIFAATQPAPVARVAPVADAKWPDPQSLTVSLKTEPYPVDALPPKVHAVVQEVVGFVQAPMALVASSALAALSLAVQPHVNVLRASKLMGPVGLFLLVVADSGERKSTCDGFFTKVVQEYEKRKILEAQPLLVHFKSSMEIWEAKWSGLKEKIRKLAAAGKPTVDLENALHQLGQEKPQKPVVPRLIYGDVTPEALAYNLATVWSYAGVVSAEAGTIFGSHGMSGDAVMRNLSMLNVFWDGGELTVDRKTTDSFKVSGARLTMSLQVQESTLRDFMNRTGSLARGTGFLARFLFAFPESTQGGRHFCEAPLNWRAQEIFNQRISELLDTSAPVDEYGVPTLKLMSLSPDAKAAWITFHDAIESQLGDGGELRDVRDVSSKSADNVARLAALFHVFEHGAVGPIGVDCLESAIRIVAWHLNESRRFFGESILTPELKNTARLDHWLIATCRHEQIQSVPAKRILQFGPSGLRDKTALDAALTELQELGRVRLLTEGKRRIVEVNPRLLGMEKVS